MESPVVVDKPPEYHGKPNEEDRGFPFEEEECPGAWSELASRYPDIAARLRQRPATWARKRRPSSQDAEDFGDNFTGFDRFPFDDIPPEFREHFPTHWGRRFSSRDEEQPQTSSQPPQSPPQQQTTATQTEQDAPETYTYNNLPQHGLRNTVDLGKKSAVDPSLVDADDRNQRSMSAPPDSRGSNNPKMSSPNNQEPHPQQEQPHVSKVRHIPIRVEGRDEPVINNNVDHGTHFGDSRPTFTHQQPRVERDQYFADDGPAVFHNPPRNFTSAFGGPYGKGFRQGAQPFQQQRVYPQTSAFARGASPQRSQSPQPKPQHTDEHKVPVHHEKPAQKQEYRPQQHQAPPHQPPPQQQPQHQQQPPPPPPQQQEQEIPQPQKPSSNDPITQILSIQTDVLNLMSEVENFTGTKKDKRYLFLDEMLTRNLIKLDTIETEGKENIRTARKEAIKCIQKCIAVLEAKAEKGSAMAAQCQTQDVDMNTEEKSEEQKTTENGEVEMNETSQEEAKVEPHAEQPQIVAEENKEEQSAQEKTETQPPSTQAENKEIQPQAADTRPEAATDEIKPEDNTDKKPKKGGKVVKKRDKSKDKKDGGENGVDEQTKGDNKQLEEQKGPIETMQVDDKAKSQSMEVDGAASQ